MKVKAALKLIGGKETGLKQEIVSRIGRLRSIASVPSDMMTMLPFKTEADTKQEVQRQTQGTLDCIERLSKIRLATYLSNVQNEIEIQIGGNRVKKTVAEWIFMKETGISLKRTLYKNGLVDAQIPGNRIMEIVDATTKEVRKEIVQPVRFFSIKEKEQKLQELLEEERAIEAALDDYNSNASITVQGEPEPVVEAAQ